MKQHENHAPSTRITPRTRLALWIGCLSIATMSPVWMLLPGPEGVIGATVHALFALTAIVALLVTTPSDAIRLSPGSSAVLLILGWAWLTFPHLALHGPVMLIAATPGFAALGFARLRRDRLTLWAAAPVLWHPASPAAAACMRLEPTTPTLASLGAVGCALLTTVLLQAAPRRPAPAAIAWIASAGFTLLLIRRLAA